MLGSHVRVRKHVVRQGNRRAIQEGEELKVTQDLLHSVIVEDGDRDPLRLWGWEYEWIIGRGEVVHG